MAWGYHVGWDTDWLNPSGEHGRDSLCSWDLRKLDKPRVLRTNTRSRSQNNMTAMAERRSRKAVVSDSTLNMNAK
jgi:hypothetical protein